VTLYRQHISKVGSAERYRLGLNLPAVSKSGAGQAAAAITPLTLCLTFGVHLMVFVAPRPTPRCPCFICTRSKSSWLTRAGTVPIKIHASAGVETDDGLSTVASFAPPRCRSLRGILSAHRCWAPSSGQLPLKMVPSTYTLYLPIVELLYIAGVHRVTIGFRVVIKLKYYCGILVGRVMSFV
jgi:hypothetical protein